MGQLDHFTDREDDVDYEGDDNEKEDDYDKDDSSGSFVCEGPPKLMLHHHIPVCWPPIMHRSCPLLLEIGNVGWMSLTEIIDVFVLEGISSTNVSLKHTRIQTMSAMFWQL